MCFLWKLCSCLNQYCCTWYPWSAAPQKIPSSWFMLKPFIEKSEKCNYSLTKNPHNSAWKTTTAKRVSLVFCWLWLKASELPSTLKSVFYTCTDTAIKSFSPPHFEHGQLTPFPRLFYSHSPVLADSLWLPSSCSFYRYIWQRQGEDTFAFTPDFMLQNICIFHPSSVWVTEGKTCYCSLNLRIPWRLQNEVYYL